MGALIGDGKTERLRKTRCWIDPDFRRAVPAPDFQSGGSWFSNPRRCFISLRPGFSPGENGPELSNQPCAYF
jgi:hypothetical protein